MNESLARTPRPWVRALTLVLLVNAAFLLLNLCEGVAPRWRLIKRVQDAFVAGDLIEDDWPGLESRRGFDQYNDCSILQMITNRDRNVWAHAVGPLIYNKNRGETDKCETLHRIITQGPKAASYMVFRYTRYWHGQDPPTAALLVAFDLGQIRWILKLTLYGALALLVLAAGTRDRGLLAVAASIGVTGVLFWAVPYFGQSLTHAYGDILVILGIVALLRWRERLSRLATLVPFCAAYGAGLVYLEFLTGQLPTAAGLLFPTAYLIARTRPEPDNHPRQAWRFALAGVTAFALGAVFTVVINQALAVAIVGPEVVRSFAEYLHRYVNPNPAASLSHFHETWSTPGDPLIWSTLKSFYVVLGEGYVLTYGSRSAALALYATAGLAWLAGAFFAFRNPVRWARSDFLACAAGTAIIVLWTWTFQTHTTLHKFWMVRMLLVTLAFAWGGLAWQLIGIPGRARAASGWATAKRMQLG